MKEIIEKIVRQEIREIITENEDAIREIVSVSLLTEIRAAVRESISRVLKDLTEEPPELVDTRQIVEDAITQVNSVDQKPEFDSKKESESGKISPKSNTSGRYLYCIVNGSERVDFGKIGIEDNEVYTIPYNDLCAVVHNCPAEPYRSEDQEIVKGWIIRHQKVLDAVLEKYGTVLPMGFDTIIQGNEVADPEENMGNWLRDDYENLKAKMEKVKEKAEYGVQILWDPKIMAQNITDEDPEIKKLNEELKSKPKGMAYMYKQKLEDLLKKEMENRADQYFKEFYEKIKPCADDLRVDKTKKTEDENKQMLMNLSCLLTKDGSRRLGDELEKIASVEGFFVRYTGPWPPYSFV